MPLPTDTYLMGSHCWFYRAGDVITTAGNYSGADVGAAGRTRRPGAADALWIDFGAIEDADLDISDTEFKTYIAAPGRLRLNDVIGTKDELMIKFTATELSAFAMENLLRTLALTSSSTQFNPLEGGQKKGWIKIQLYDQNDALRLTMDIWGRLKVAGSVQVGGADLVKLPFEFLVLHSTLNSGTL